MTIADRVRELTAAGWLPRWLDRLLPDLDIEGKDLRTHDHAASRAGTPHLEKSLGLTRTTEPSSL